MAKKNSILKKLLRKRARSEANKAKVLGKSSVYKRLFKDPKQRLITDFISPLANGDNNTHIESSIKHNNGSHINCDHPCNKLMMDFYNYASDNNRIGFLNFLLFQKVLIPSHVPFIHYYMLIEQDFEKLSIIFENYDSKDLIEKIELCFNEYEECINSPDIIDPLKHLDNYLYLKSLFDRVLKGIRTSFFKFTKS